MIGWLSLFHLVVFLSFDLFFHLGHISLSRPTYYTVRDGALGIRQGGVTHPHIHLLCVGEGSYREWCHLLGSWPAFSYFPHSLQAYWALPVLIPGGWVCVCCRTLLVSPTNSPVRLGISPASIASTDFYRQRF